MVSTSLEGRREGFVVEVDADKFEAYCFGVLDSEKADSDPFAGLEVAFGDCVVG